MSLGRINYTNGKPKPIERVIIVADKMRFCSIIIIILYCIVSLDYCLQSTELHDIILYVFYYRRNEYFTVLNV